jgi:hypothetical protein
VIVTAVWSLLTGAVTLLLSPLSVFPSPPDLAADVHNALASGGTHFGEPSSILSLAGWTNNYLPVSDALTVFALLIGIVLATSAIKATMWVLSKTHVTGGGDD